ncbi:hypothetical protein [Demequina subtropica]|uniref:WXG100-like domain-containing protein n=1 Tax=Demequina subtropica TaxID=1638989 RepID=UPI0007811A59|nr:hypothetical protein [Demequina subtropica]
MTYIDLEPLDYADAADIALAREKSLHAAIAMASAGLAGGYEMAGTDSGGDRFSESYDRVARAVFQEVLDVADGVRTAARVCVRIGALHASAERANQGLAGPGPGFDDPGAPMPACPVMPPSSAGGTSISVPELQSVVDFVGSVTWPDADIDRLRAASVAWNGLAGAMRNEAKALGAVADRLSGIVSPERAALVDALRALESHVDDLADRTGAGDDGLGGICWAYAQEVEETRRATEDELKSLLAELVVTGVVSVALGVITFGGSAAVGAAAAEARAAVCVYRIGQRALKLKTWALKSVASLDKQLVKAQSIPAWRRVLGNEKNIRSKVAFAAIKGATGSAVAAPSTSDDPNIPLSALYGGAGAAFGAGLTSLELFDRLPGDIFAAQISAMTIYSADAAFTDHEFSAKDLATTTVTSALSAGVTAGAGRSRNKNGKPDVPSESDLGTAGGAVGRASAITAARATADAGGPMAGAGSSTPRVDVDGVARAGADAAAATIEPLAHRADVEAPRVSGDIATAMPEASGSVAVPQGEAPLVKEAAPAQAGPTAGSGLPSGIDAIAPPDPADIEVALPAVGGALPAL